MRSVFSIGLLVMGILVSWTMLCFGDFYVVPTVKKNYAPVQKTGQTRCYDVDGNEVQCATSGQGQDGDLQKGVARPSPRFTVNNDGTVKDNLTGLVWLRNASCIDTPNSFSNALLQASLLQHGLCGLSDGSSPGDWRLPNRFELESLLDLGFISSPTLTNAAGTGQWQDGDPFYDVKDNDSYWSSTTNMSARSQVWIVSFSDGHVFDADRLADTCYVWPVRGGQ
ncbi:MAG: DUF1566 domain-containing protein [Desulforhabdus sp.]|jgi:hypothetical protein|nr:DUF1566 domain-containing protein [Desulforhabdus sp.]